MGDRVGSRGLASAALAGAALLLGAAEAAANHSHGATYTGTHNGPGQPGPATVEFKTSADGTQVTEFKVTNVEGSFCDFPQANHFNPVPINNHSFSHTASTGLSFSGSFPSNQNASGTLQVRSFVNPCVSNTYNWTATTPTPPPGGGGGGGGGGGTGTQYPDFQPPDGRIFGPRTQRAGRVVRVGVTSRNETSTATGRGVVNVPNRFLSRRFRLGSARARVPRGSRRTLRLRVPRRALRGIRRALRARRRIAVRVTVTFRDAAGNRSVRRRTIRLRR